MAVSDAIDKGENLCDGLVNLLGNFGFEIELRENLHEVLVVANWNMVLPRQLEDFVREVPRPLATSLGAASFFGA